MMDIVVLATASLIVQIAVLAVLIASYVLKSQKRYRGHGITMSVAFVLHLTTIFTVMLPSLISYLSSPGTLNFSDASVIISLLHASLGVIGVSMGGWLAASWHLRKDLGPMFAKKRIMLPTLIVWITAILIGIYVYLSLYYTIIVG